MATLMAQSSGHEKSEMAVAAKAPVSDGRARKAVGIAKAPIA
jgi:hypothetical protein